MSCANLPTEPQEKASTWLKEISVWLMRSLTGTPFPRPLCFWTREVDTDHPGGAHYFLCADLFVSAGRQKLTRNLCPLSPEEEIPLRRMRKVLEKDCNLIKRVVGFTQTIIILLPTAF